MWSFPEKILIVFLIKSASQLTCFMWQLLLDNQVILLHLTCVLYFVALVYLVNNFMGRCTFEFCWWKQIGFHHMGRCSSWGDFLLFRTACLLIPRGWTVAGVRWVESWSLLQVWVHSGGIHGESEAIKNNMFQRYSIIARYNKNLWHTAMKTEWIASSLSTMARAYNPNFFREMAEAALQRPERRLAGGDNNV